MLAGVLLLLATPGLARTDAPARDDREVVMVWGTGFGPDSKGFETLVREFERRHPRYRVRVLSLGVGGMNPQKLMTAIVGNVPPDVVHQDRFSVSDWAKRGAFLPLDDLIARDVAAGDPYVPRAEEYYEAPWMEAQFNGRQYAIPTSADNRTLHWNKRVFRESAADLRAAGLDPERPPRTWSEVLAYSRVLTRFDENGNLTRAGWLPNFGNSWLYLFAFQNNAEFLSPDGRVCTLYTPESEEALQFMVDGYDLLGGYEEAMKFQGTFRGQEHDPFFTGQVAMKVDGDWVFYGIARFAPNLEFGAAPAPVPDDRFYRRGRFVDEKDTFITWTGGFSWAIPRGAKNVEGGWAFIKFATSLEGRMLEMRSQNEWERRRGRQFVPRILAHRPTNEAAFRELAPVNPFIRDALRMHIDMQEFSRMRPPTFVGQLLWDEHVRAIENACRKRMTPREALIAGQTVVQRVLDEEFKKERFPVIDMRVPAFIGLFGAVIGVGVWYAAFFGRTRIGRLGKIEARWAYLFVAPWLIGFLVFTLGPMLASLFFSFTQYNVLSEARWVGLANYQDLIDVDRANILKSFSNVLYLGGIGVPLGLVTGLAVALLLNAGVRGMRYYRTLFYLPAIVPGVAATVLWMWILSPDPNRGLFNAAWLATITEWFAVQPPGWLSAEAWAKPSLILMGLWGAGGGMILWLAGLKGIPNTLYEAASIDGATPGQQFWSVTVPQLSPIIFFNTVMGFIGSLQEFDRVYVATQGGGAGPGDALLTPVFLLFENGFSYFRMGYASALAWVIFLIVLILTLIQFKLAPKWVHYEGRR
jgi:multiple sugar transport system permease protein